ncbi:Zinc finger protein 521 [Acipenser ruthenus]|uniref:Zinc finger protein 521 n=1 Tax=Acipenser ruthenus TaxID=7906 RepID=A0A444UJ59_ACIRT|nr:Zinc finger protein 521 [Acipenser ruthenus]
MVQRNQESSRLFTSHKHALQVNGFNYPNCKLGKRAEDGEEGDLKKRLISLEEGEEIEDEALHSCDSCLQVFESLSDLTEHKINQCQLTGIVPVTMQYKYVKMMMFYKTMWPPDVHLRLKFKTASVDKLTPNFISIIPVTVSLQLTLTKIFFLGTGEVIDLTRGIYHQNPNLLHGL